MSPVAPNGVIVLLLLLSQTARAQEEDPDYQFQVTAPSASAESVREAAGFATTIDAEESTARVETVSGLLEKSAGVVTRRLGGLGSFATVSLRGSASSQVLVLLDGVPLSSGVTSTVNVDAIPPDLLESVDVYRSGAPIWWGAAPMGGVVHLRTRQERENSFALSASYGSFLTRKATAIARIALIDAPELDVLAGLTYVGSEGGFPFYDDRGTPYNVDDDVETARENNAFDGGTLLFRSSLRPTPRLELTLLETGTLDRRGIPGLGQYQSTSTTVEQIRSITQLVADSVAFPAEVTDTSLRLFADVLSQRFSDREGETGLGRRDISVGALALGGQLRVSTFPLPWIEVHTVLDGRWEDFTSSDAVTSSADEITAARMTITPSVQVATRFVDERLVSTLGGRVDIARSSFLSDDTERNDNVVAVQGGLSYRIGDAPLEVIARATAGAFGRLPTFVEMFGDTGAVVGNEDLLPESAVGGDLGLDLSWEAEVVGLDVTLAAFFYDFQDLIQFIQNSQSSARPENVAAARLTGLETSVAAGLWSTAWLSVAYTYTEAFDTSGVVGQDGNVLPGRPEHVISSAVSSHWLGIEAEYRVDFESSNTLDRAGYSVVPERFFHSARASYTPTFLSEWTLTVEVRNLLDRRTELVPVLPQPPGVDVSTPRAVSDYLGFPLPGRTFYITLRWQKT